MTYDSDQFIQLLSPTLGKVMVVVLVVLVVVVVVLLVVLLLVLLLLSLTPCRPGGAGWQRAQVGGGGLRQGIYCRISL